VDRLNENMIARLADVARAAPPWAASEGDAQGGALPPWREEDPPENTAPREPSALLPDSEAPQDPPGATPSGGGSGSQHGSAGGGSQGSSARGRQGWFAGLQQSAVLPGSRLGSHQGSRQGSGNGSPARSQQGSARSHQSAGGSALAQRDAWPRSAV